MTADVLTVEGLTVRYGDVLALDDVALTLAPGAVCALLGVNGSGKSTLFKAVTQLVRPDRGTVTVHGRSPAVARREGRIAYMPQAADVDCDFPVLVRDVVTMGRYGRMGPARRASATDRRTIDSSLDRVGLADLADRRIGALSGGQRRRVFVARALAQEASLLLLDEPFAGVDAASQATIIEILHALRDDGASILVSTHDLAGAGELCDRAVLLHRRVLATGTADEVLTPQVLGRVFGLDTAARPGRVA